MTVKISYNSTILSLPNEIDHCYFAGFLTIGILTVKRKGDLGVTYLLQTLASLVAMATSQEQQEITLVIFLADFDLNYNQHLLHAIKQVYSDHIDTGFIHIMMEPRGLYPKLHDLQFKADEDPAIHQQRSKQVVDFALMFLYARNLSEYYLQIEDDVLDGQDFLAALKDFVVKQNRGGSPVWTVLPVTIRDLMGKLVRSSELVKLATYLMTFYDERSVDWLLDHYQATETQDAATSRPGGG